MIHIKPVSKNKHFDSLKEALDIDTVPIFFQYLGAFPEYFDYIADQLIVNLKDRKFDNLMMETKNTIRPLIKSGLPKSEDLKEWLSLYRNTPSFYYFQKNIEKIFITNIKLAYIFIALREAVKGWAVAAKKLPNTVDIGKRTQETETGIDIGQFIVGDTLTLTATDNRQVGKQQSELTKSSPDAIEPDSLPEYMKRCRNEFWQHMKTEQCLMIRLGTEKIILRSLSMIPNLIFSPVNVVIRLSQKYPEFSELLYLLSEHFPTYAVQRLMFSGFMQE